MPKSFCCGPEIRTFPQPSKDWCSMVSELQFITFGFACTPLYFVWEKVIGMHDTKSIFLRALARLPVVIPIWFLAIVFPFFGPINSAVGALLVSFTVYIIPSVAHMLTYRKASARQVNHNLLLFLYEHTFCNYLDFEGSCMSSIIRDDHIRLVTSSAWIIDNKVYNCNKGMDLVIHEIDRKIGRKSFSFS